jgi:hypothetical protein
MKSRYRQGSYHDNKILDSASFNEMTKIQNADKFPDRGNPNGLAWRIYFNDAGKCIEHAGGTINNRAELGIAPQAEVVYDILF